MKELPMSIYKSMVDAVPTAVLLIQDGVFVDCNQFAVKILNARDKSDIIGKPPSLISPERQPDGSFSDEKSRVAIEAAMQGRAQRFHWQHITLDKKTLNVEVTMERITVDGVTYLQSSFRDLKVQVFLAKDVELLSQAYAKMAEGDLTVRVELIKPDEDTREYDEMIIKLRDAVRGIVISLQKNIGDVNKNMQNLTSTADNANKSIGEATQGVNQIAKNAGEVSTNAQKAADGIEQMSKAMQDMSAAVEEITSSMESVSTQAKAANDSAKEGAVLAENVNKDMGEITVQAGKTYDVVKDIEKQMADISKIIVLIRDLANQTNLLALNAAIEAARAGEHGRGFAVVASEVKSLAQESRASAEKIEEMITHLNIATKTAGDGMEEAKVLVGKGATAAQQALESFKKIQKAAETVANSASEVAAATEEQAATTEEITASVHEVGGLIERTAKEASDAAAATEESAAALDEITRMIQAVNDIAVEAMNANRRFKVE
ncbi:MAG TPA: methyl-accepting chemotaxis protein [Methanoregula sp.]|nr:methyl-accepting chemotaxis protein [Methanoregula sp.]